jgi:tetratricopeptide (TPR) repeat protein
MQSTGHEKEAFVFNASSISLKAVFSVAVAILAFSAIYRNYGVFRAARIVQSELTLESHTRALKSDPSNARLWWNRGRLHHYSLSHFDIVQAVSDYNKALLLNPYLGKAWVDLSDCYDRIGRSEEAEAALEKAVSVHRYSPLIRWQAGNFYLRRSNLPKMYECFRIACQYDIGKLGIAMETAWKIDPNHDGILNKLVPDNLPSNMMYLAFLVARDELDLAQPVWKRCLNNSIREDYEFMPSAVFGYLDRLLSFNRVSEALQVWYDALRKAQVTAADFRLQNPASDSRDSTSGNLIWNGSFENEILQGGFDWRYPITSEVGFQIDASNRIHKLKSLQVTFGRVNIASSFLSQIVPLMESGPYRLDFYLQTKDLTTDQLPYLTIEGFPDAALASARSDFFPATTSWSKLSVPFIANRGCKAIKLSLQRNPSVKFDNQIKGTLWLDGFVLHRQGDADTDRKATAGLK